MIKEGSGWLILVLFLVLLSRTSWSDSSAYATTPEGFWVRIGSGTLYFQEFSPYPFLLNAALLGGASYISSFSPEAYKALPKGEWLAEKVPLWLGRVGKAVSLGGSAWHLSSLIEQQGWWKGAGTALGVDMPLPGVGSRLLLAVDQRAEDITFSLVPNPLLEPVPLSSGPDSVTRALLSIHKEMTAQSLGRLDLIPFYDQRGAGLRVGWRNASHRWKWLSFSVRFKTIGGGQWVELPDRNFGEPAISIFQPKVLNTVLHALKVGHAAGLAFDVDVPLLNLDWTSDGFWTVNISHEGAGSGGVSVFLEGVTKQGGIEKLRFLHTGEESVDDGFLYRVPQSWTTLAQLMLNVSWLVSGYRPDFGIKKGAMWGRLPNRLTELQSGKMLVAGLTAPVARKRMGIPITDVVVEHDPDLRDSNRVDFSRDIFQTIANTTTSRKWQFELTGRDGRKVWAANSQKGWRDDANHAIYMSEHDMNALQVRPKDTISLVPVELEPIGHLELAVKKGPYLDYDELSQLITQPIVDRYPTLREGEHIRINAKNGNQYEFVVKPGQLKNKNMQPAGAVYTLGAEPNFVVEYPDHWPAGWNWDTFVHAGKVVTPDYGYELGSGKRKPPLSVAEAEKKAQAEAVKAGGAGGLTGGKTVPFSGAGYTTRRGKLNLSETGQPTP